MTHTATTPTTSPNAAAAHAREQAHCYNCGALALANYCGECGQETTLHPPTVWEFVHHFITHYVAAEGKLWATLGKLLRPGALTQEYLVGRRARYVHPLRLYLTFSVLLFLGISLTGTTFGLNWHAAAGDGMEGAQAVTPKKIGEPAATNMNARVKADQDDPQWVKDLEAKVDQLQDPVARKRFRKSVMAYVPYALMLLVPLLAAYLKLIYRSRKVLYGEHLVFAMHVQTMLFILLAVPLVLRFELVDTLATLLFLLYLIVALKRVYAGRWWASLLRGLFVYIVYLASAGLAVVAVMAMTLVMS